jgi:hypothetical protein
MEERTENAGGKLILDGSNGFSVITLLPAGSVPHEHGSSSEHGVAQREHDGAVHEHGSSSQEYGSSSHGCNATSQEYGTAAGEASAASIGGKTED